MLKLGIRFEGDYTWLVDIETGEILGEGICFSIADYVAAKQLENFTLEII